MKRLFKEHSIIILIYIFVLQDFIENIPFLSIFKYFDEIFCLLFFPLYISYLIDKRRDNVLDRKDNIILLLNLFLFIAGCLSTINNTRSLPSIIPDVIICFKFILSIYTTVFLIKYVKINDIIGLVNKHLRIITMSLFLLLVLDIIFNLFPSGYIRFGLRSTQLIFEHPGRLVSVGVFILAFLVYLENFDINNNKYIIFALTIILSTLRAKALGIILIFSFLYYWIVIKSENIKLKNLIAISPFVIIGAWQQISDYYITNSEASRLLLTETAFKIANDYFPFGSGFSSFGSAYSIRPYSSFYYMYDLWDKWGVSVQWNQDISDTFWPMLLAQFGYLGLIFFSLALIILIIKILKLHKISKYYYLSGMLMITSLLISSTSESAFVHPFSVSFAFLIGILLSERTVDNE